MSERPLGKKGVIKEITEATGLRIDQVKAVLDRYTEIIKRELATKSLFILLGLIRIRKCIKAGHKGGRVPDLKNPGQYIETERKPDKNTVRFKALAPLRKMV